MSWYDGILQRFVPEKRYSTINGERVVMELDTFGLHTSTKLFYGDNTKYVELQEQNFVLSNVIDKIAKSLSNAHFSDEDENSLLLDKINQPNDQQSKEEFLKEFAIYLMASGYGMIWKKWQSVGNFETLQLININPDKADVGENTIKAEIEGKSETINKVDIIFFYDVRKNVNDKKGYSRIKPLRSHIKNINDAQVAKNIQICNSGITIVSPKANQQANNIDEGLNTPIVQPAGMRTQKDDMEDKLNSRGIQNRIIVANKGVDATNLSSQLSSLKFYEMVETDILAIYDAFGFPIELSPYGKNATFENKAVAENSMIENEIMPLAESFVKSLNSEFEKYGNLSVDFDHISSVAKTKNEIHETNRTIVDTYISLLDKQILDVEQVKQILTDKGILT